MGLGIRDYSSNLLIDKVELIKNQKKMTFGYLFKSS